MILQVEEGAEMWLPWARRKLAWLGEVRRDARLDRMTKSFAPADGVLVTMSSCDDGDSLRITGGSITPYYLPLAMPVPDDLGTARCAGTATDIVLLDYLSADAASGSATLTPAQRYKGAIVWTGAAVHGSYSVAVADDKTSTKTWTNWPVGGSSDNVWNGVTTYDADGGLTDDTRTTARPGFETHDPAQGNTCLTDPTDFAHPLPNRTAGRTYSRSASLNSIDGTDGNLGPDTYPHYWVQTKVYRLEVVDNLGNVAMTFNETGSVRNEYSAASPPNTEVTTIAGMWLGANFAGDPDVGYYQPGTYNRSNVALDPNGAGGAPFITPLPYYSTWQTIRDATDAMNSATLHDAWNDTYTSNLAAFNAQPAADDASARSATQARLVAELTDPDMRDFLFRHCADLLPDVTQLDRLAVDSYPIEYLADGAWQTIPGTTRTITAARAMTRQTAQVLPDDGTDPVEAKDDWSGKQVAVSSAPVDRVFLLRDKNLSSERAVAQKKAWLALVKAEGPISKMPDSLRIQSLFYSLPAESVDV